MILVKSKRAGERVKASITRFLEKKLKLKVNQAKSRAGKANDCKFLGFTFPGKTIRWTPDSLDEFKHKVRKLTGRSFSISEEQRVAELNRYIRGWINYFVLSKYWTPVPELDAWIRRRIRCCIWKQWKTPRNRVRQMTKLGLNTPHPGEAATLLGISTKEVQENRFDTVEKIAKLFGSTVVLKGASTICFDGQIGGVNSSGGPFLATAGSGDVLSGIISAFLASGSNNLAAASLGAFLHGVAGELAFQDHNGPIISSDIIDKIPFAIGRHVAANS